MNQQYNLVDKALAWSVHIFTASGLLAGFMAILAINASDWRGAMFWLLVALVIDGIDGTFCLLYTSPSPRDATLSRMPSSA